MYLHAYIYDYTVLYNDFFYICWKYMVSKKTVEIITLRFIAKITTIACKEINVVLLSIKIQHDRYKNLQLYLQLFVP